MKSPVLQFAWAALAGVAALACSREPVQKVDSATVRTVNFRAMGAKTKAQFGEKDGETWPTLWTANDSEVKLSLNYGSALAAAVIPSEDFRSATFSATVDFGGVSAPYTYYSVSPPSVAKALSPSREAWKVSIPSVQTPSAGSPDEHALIIAATSDPYQDAGAASDVDLYFNHLTAYGCISLTGLDLTDESVQAVELTSTEPFVGDWYWKCVSHELIDYGASSTLSLKVNHPDNVWFGCAPVVMSGQMWTVSLLTDAGTYSKLIEFDGSYVFQAGVVAQISVDMSTDDVVFTATGSGSGSGASVTASMDTFTSTSGYVDGDENVSYEAAKGNAQTVPAVNNDQIRIYQNGGLLTVTANNDKTITGVTIGSAMATSVQVSIDGGSFGSNNSITAGGTFSTGPISASTVVFKCTGTDKSHRLYLNSLSVTYEGDGAGGSSQEDPLLQESNYGCWLGSGLEWEYNPGTNQVTRSYSASGVLTYTLVQPSTVEELEIIGYTKSKLKGDSFPVTVTWRRGTTTLVPGTQYAVTLIKEDGPKVWLSTGGGKGFIIKK